VTGSGSRATGHGRLSRATPSIPTARSVRRHDCAVGRWLQTDVTPLSAVQTRNTVREGNCRRAGSAALLRNVLRALVVGLPTLGLPACGGGNGGGSGVAIGNAPPGGIWQGTDPLTNLALYGIVTEAGAFSFLRSDGAQYYGTLATSGNNISGTFTGVPPIGKKFADGSTRGTGTVSGTIQARTSISAAYSFTTANGKGSSGSGRLAFNSLYFDESSLATIAGNYADSFGNSVISVDSSGVVFDQQLATGCVLNGQISIINTAYNAYQVQYTFASCLGSYAILNGTTATGLGVFDTGANPAVAYVGVANDAVPYVLNAEYTK